MTDQEFMTAAEAVSVPLSEEQASRFIRYEALLRSWAERVRLVSRGDRDRIRARHFIESLRVVPFLPEGPISLLDLGSGGGFPGVPVKIARPEVEVVLLESARMKALFLKHLVGELEMDGLSVLHGAGGGCLRTRGKSGEIRYCNCTCCGRPAGPVAPVVRLPHEGRRAVRAQGAWRAPGGGGIRAPTVPS